MDSQGSSSGSPANEEPETVVDEQSTAVQPDSSAGGPGAAQAAPTGAGSADSKGRFLDRFGRGSIAAVAAVGGIVLGAGGALAIDGDDHHRGWKHHGPGMGAWGDRDGDGPHGPGMWRRGGGWGQGGPGYGGQGYAPAPPQGQAVPQQGGGQPGQGSQTQPGTATTPNQR